MNLVEFSKGIEGVEDARWNPEDMSLAVYAERGSDSRVIQLRIWYHLDLKALQRAVSKVTVYTEAEALRAPPNPKASGIRAGELL